MASETFSTEQREAMASGVLDRGLSAKKVAQLASDGQLAPGLAPIQVSPSTVQRAAGAERERRLQDPSGDARRGDLGARLAEVQRRAVKMVELAADQLEQEQKAGKIDGKHLSRLQQLLGLVRSAQNMMSRAPHAGDSDPGAEPEPKTSRLLEELAEKERLAGQRLEANAAAGDVDHDSAG